MYKKLSGPVSLTIYEYNNTKYIFFGDVHNKEKICDNCEKPECINIVSLFEEIAEKSVELKIRTNFFLEDVYNPKNNLGGNIYEHRGNDSLTDVMIKFNNCLKIDKTLCPYAPYVQFHYCNVREIKETFDNNIPIPSTIFNIYYEILERARVLLRSLELSEDTKSWDSFAKEYIKYIIDKIMYMAMHSEDMLDIYFKENGFAKFNEFIKEINEITQKTRINSAEFDLMIKANKILFKGNEHKIFTQIREIKDRELSDRLYNFLKKETQILRGDFMDKILTIQQRIYLTIRMIDENKISFASGMESLSYYIMNILFEITSSIVSKLMDAYLLGRMFKYQNIDANVVYVGDAHKLFYDKFMQKELKLDPIINIVNDDRIQCLVNDQFYDKIFMPIFYAKKYNKYYKKYKAIKKY